MRWRTAALAVLLAATAGCGLTERPVVNPIPVRVYGDLAAAERVYLLLPGMRDGLDTFEDTGFIEIARNGLDGHERAAFVAVDAHIGYYREGTIQHRIKDEVVGRFLSGKRVTAVGVSLGGIGALATVRRYPGLFDRLVLFAPFLGWPEDIERLRNGTVPSPNDDNQKKLFAVWRWLAEKPDRPPVIVLYGRDDDFRPAYELLAERAPGVEIRHIEGGHRWRTWNALWREWLARR